MLIKSITAPHLKLFFFFSLLLLSLISHAADIPKLNAWVIDETKTLTKKQINILSEKLANHERDSSNQFVVLIIKTLDKETIEDYSSKVFKHWRLGQLGKENGLLLVIAKNDRQLRIEVGDDLADKINSTLVKNVIKDDMTPLIKKNDYFDAIGIAVDKLITKATSNHNDIKALIPNWPISLTIICTIFTLIIPLSLRFSSIHLFKKPLPLKTCYLLYFIPSVALSLALLNLLGSSIKSGMIIFIYCITITLSSYVNAGILLFLIRYIHKAISKK